jgi:hypothetical protein
LDELVRLQLGKPDRLENAGKSLAVNTHRSSFPRNKIWTQMIGPSPAIASLESNFPALFVKNQLGIAIGF